MTTLSRETMSAHLINLSGPLHGSQAEDLSRQFKALAKKGVTQVVVNLAGVPLLDSRGLAALITGHKLFGRQEQNFRLAGAQDQPKLVFELTGFDHIFQMFASVAEAMTAQPQRRSQPVYPVPAPVAQLTQPGQVSTLA